VCLGCGDNTYLSLPPTAVFFQNKRTWKHAGGGESLLMWAASLFHYPLGHPVNLWTTGTVGQQFVLSVHCVKLVWVVSPHVTVILSRNVFIFWWMFIRVWCYYQFCDVSVSKVSSCGHTAKCTSTQLGITQTQHFLADRDSSICTAWPVVCYWSGMEQTQVLSWR